MKGRSKDDKREQGSDNVAKDGRGCVIVRALRYVNMLYTHREAEREREAGAAAGSSGRSRERRAE